MEKDPLLLKDEEVDAIVGYLQTTFKNWQAEEATASMNERRAKPAAGISEKKASKAEIKKIDLGDLGL